MICVRGKNAYHDDFHLSGKYFHMTYKNVAITMECFGLYWCKAMKETIVLCHKHSAKKKIKKRESYATRAAITEKGKKDEIKTEYEKIV